MAITGKKRRFALIGLLVFLGIATALILRKPPSSEALPSLRQYVTKEKLLYEDPGEAFKRWVAFSGERMTLEQGEIDPVVIRVATVENIAFEDLEKLVEQDLTAGDRWTIQEWPLLRPFSRTLMFPPEETRETIIATKGGDIVPLKRFGGGIGTTEHSITVEPDSKSGSVGSTFLITETRRLTKWEVVLLKVKRLGRNAFATEEETSKFYDD